MPVSADGAHVATVVVAPRLGTLSPWASKATDIAHNCGVDVRRVERVTEYHLATDAPLTEEEWGAAADLLHDRMTEAALPTRADAAALFDEREAEPMEHVDVLGRGRAADRGGRTPPTGWRCPTTRSTTSSRPSPGCAATRPTSS